MKTLPFFLEQFTDQSGKPLSNGSLTFLVAGSSSIPKDIYTDYQLTTKAANPFSLDSVGRAPQYYVESGMYKIVVKDQSGSIIATRDYVEGDNSTSGTPTVLDYKVKTNTQDSTPGFLVDKIRNSSTVTVNTTDIGGHDYIMSFSVNQASLSAIPLSGAAGGDLDGTYPNPIVKQLTGLEAAIVPKSPGFSYPTDPAMTGISPGYSYINGLKTKVWMAISFSGKIRLTADDWKTTVEDVGLYSRNIGVNWNALSYIPVGSDFYWIAGDGANQSFYMVEDVISNYNSNGTIKSTAWVKNDYPSTDYNANRLMPSNVGDIATANGITCWIGNSTYIGRTLDFQTFTSQRNDAYSNFGGIATDGYDTWLAVSKGSGQLYKSVGTSGVTWSTVSSIFVDGVASVTLPTTNGEEYGSLLCSYGTWIAAVYSGSAGHISYAFSTDGLNWTTVKNNDIVFFSAASDGKEWYATNPAPNSSNPIFQLLISEIPAHKKLIAEKGLVVAGNMNLVDLPNVSLLATDTYGKIVSADPNIVGGGKVFLDEFDTTKDYLHNKINSDASKGTENTIVQNGSGSKSVFLYVNGKTVINSTDTVYGYLQDKILPGAGITITSAVDSGGQHLVINSKGNSWKLIRYVSTNTTVIDTDDTLIIRATGVSIALPIPSAAYEGRIVTIRCAGGSNSGNVTGSIVGSSALSGLQKLEFCCYNTGSAYFWVQQ